MRTEEPVLIQEKEIETRSFDRTSESLACVYVCVTRRAITQIAIFFLLLFLTNPRTRESAKRKSHIGS